MLKIAAVMTDLFEDSEFTSPRDAIVEADPADYDALLIPGGYSPDTLRADERFLDFVRHFSKEEKYIYSICHAPQLLVNADVLRGKDATSVSQVGVDIINAGGNYIDEPVVIDDSGLISSRTPADLPQFNEAIVSSLNKLEK